MAEKYIISPIEHLLSLDKPSLHMFSGAADWPSKNLTIDQKRLKKRWGYLEDRDVEENVQLICIYQQNDGTRWTLYLTDTDFIKKDSGTGLDDWTSIKSAAYTVPANERWQVAVVADKFCFTNGNVNVQYWAGSGTAAALDSTYATNAKYCIEYGNRLCLANLKVGGAFAPWTLRSSANGDPTKWSTEDTTAVDYEFIETDDVISGLGKVGASLIVYKTESLLIGHKTAKATDPFIFPTQKRGVGCTSPYSIIEFLGTNAFRGRDDFYMLDGDHPVSIGERIRYKFNEIVSPSEAENMCGFNNALEHELIWIVNTSQGKFAFVFDYKDREWGVYQYFDNMSGAGRGAV